MITIFLSATTIKQYCPDINGEIDNTLIDNVTRLVQSTLLKDTLTQDFYDDLYSKWISPTWSVNTAYVYLKETYLDWILALGVWKHLTINMSYQLNSAGLRIKLSDHSQAAETSDIDFIRKYIDNFIDARRKEMSRYIYDHQSDYPLYYSDKYGDMPAKNNFAIGRVGGTDLYDSDYPYWRTIK